MLTTTIPDVEILNLEILGVPAEIRLKYSLSVSESADLVD